MAKRMSEDQIVKAVIKKYGAVINLKETPYILTEILRDHGARFSPDGGLPPGGVAPGGPATRKIDNAVILKEILKLGDEIRAMKKSRG